MQTALIGALTDIVEKTTSFTASTVPASRTVDGADFYTSFFLPLGADPFWEGHLQAYHITASGDLEDANGNCALDDPTGGRVQQRPVPSGCRRRSGTPARRCRRRDRGRSTPACLAGAPLAPSRVAFGAGLTAAQLALLSFGADGDASTPAPNRTYPGSIAAERGGPRGRDRAVPPRLQLRQRRADRRRDRRRRGVCGAELAPGRHLPLEPGGGGEAGGVHHRAQLSELQDLLRDPRSHDLRGLERGLPARLPRRRLAGRRGTPRSTTGAPGAEVFGFMPGRAAGGPNLPIDSGTPRPLQRRRLAGGGGRLGARSPDADREGERRQRVADACWSSGLRQGGRSLLRPGRHRPERGQLPRLLAGSSRSRMHRPASGPRSARPGASR